MIEFQERTNYYIFDYDQNNEKKKKKHVVKAENEIVRSPFQSRHSRFVITTWNVFLQPLQFGEL